MSYFRIWVYLAYVKTLDLKRVKLASKAYEYATNSKTYRFYDLNAKIIIELNDVEFYENSFSFQAKNSGGIDSNHILIILSNESNNWVQIELRWSKRVRVAKDYKLDYTPYTVEEDLIHL